MSPFTPKGAQPEWKLIYDALLANADFGRVISFTELDEALGRPFAVNRSPLYRARLQLGDQRSRWLEAVPGIGYRIIEANEHLVEAQRRKQRAKRQFGMMVKIADYTDISKLTTDELATFDTQTKVNRLLYGALVLHERRIARLEEALNLRD